MLCRQLNLGIRARSRPRNHQSLPGARTVTFTLVSFDLHVPVLGIKQSTVLLLGAGFFAE